MVFSAAPFLFLFLPLALIFIAPLPRAWQNSSLLIVSIGFYLWGAGSGITSIASVGALSWILALALARMGARRVRLVAVWLSCAVVAAPLLTAKYVPVVQAWLADAADPVVLALPLGISFFTFHALSYLIDVYHRRIPAEHRPDHYALYLFLFPHQIAGPIVRYGEIVHEIKARIRPRATDVLYGLSRFGWGLMKKVAIGDPAGQVAAASWDAVAEGRVTALVAWIGAIAFTVQIYFDFSGYSDMAIGLARVFGFHFPENFAGPYRSASATDYWRRWHMTLSRWFRDYVYIPLGGNRHGALRGYAALITTFALTSVWHGATWPYLLWGGIWSALLIMERVTGLRDYQGALVARRAVMVLVLVVSWVPFRSATMTQTLEVWRAMLAGTWTWPEPSFLVLLTPITVGAMVLGMLVFLLPDRGRPRVFDRLVLDPAGDLQVGRALVIGPAALLIGCMMSLWSSFSPFLYFQF